MDIKERLTHKLGPLPVWAWIGAAGAGVFVLTKLGGNKGSGANDATTSSSGTRAATPFLPISGSELPIVDDPQVPPVAPAPTPIGTVAPTDPNGGIATAISPDAGKYVLINNKRTGTQDLSIINAKGETSGLTWEQMTNPDKNPLWKLLKDILPIQSAAEADRVAPSQVGTGIPMGFRADGSVILAYSNKVNTFAPIITNGVIERARQIIANSPTPADAGARQNIPAMTAFPANNGSSPNMTIINEQVAAAQAAGEQLTAGQQMYMAQQAAAQAAAK